MLRMPQSYEVPFYNCTQRSPVRDNTFHPDHKRSFERVEQWLLQQNDFVAVPPPDNISLSSTKSNINIEPQYLDHHLPTNDFPPLNHSYQYRSDSHINNSHHDRNEYLVFRGLQSRRYYSPNLNRRRPTNSRESHINQLYTSTQSALDQVDSGYSTQTRRNEILSRSYQDQLDKVNTFPRRRRFTREHPPIPRSLLQENRMGQQFDKQPVDYKERVTTNPYATSVTPKIEKNIRKPLVRPKSWTDGRKNISQMTEVQCDEQNLINNHSSNVPTRISRDTQRLLAGNLPDVALTAAKALHKRELSDSLPKFPYKTDPTHVRMNSAPEPRDCEYTIDNNETNANFREETAKKASNLLRKVKAFSWPKRAVLHSYNTNNLKQENSLEETKNNNNLNYKTESSGYITEKSEENKEKLIIEEPIIKETEVKKTQKKISLGEEIFLLDHKSLSEESDCPPERPPLPKLKDISKTQSSPQNTLLRKRIEKNESIENTIKESSVENNITENSSLNTLKQTIPNEQEIFEKLLPVTIKSPSKTPAQACKINIKPKTVEYKVKVNSSNDLYKISTEINNKEIRKVEKVGNEVPNNTNDYEEYVNNENNNNTPCKVSTLIITPRKNKNYESTEKIFEDDHKKNNHNDQIDDINHDRYHKDDIHDHRYHKVNENDLSRSVSMSLRDLIRIHEQEIARVSGRSNNKLDNNTLDKRKSCIIETRPKSQHNENWKRHTTIGIITDHNQFDISDSNNHFRTQSDDIDRRRIGFKHEALKPSLSLSVNVNLNETSHQRIPSNVSSFNSHSYKRSPPIISPRSRASVHSEFCYDEQKYSSEPLFSPTSSTSNKSLFSRDVSIQTEKDEEELKKINETKKNIEYYEEQILYLTDENERLKQEFNEERIELRKRLDEQKKVANAYQKLEDRYRRRAVELQKHIRKCGCFINNTKSYIDDDESSSRAMSPATYHRREEHQTISVQQVDGILSHLEQWLNNQNNGINTDNSEVSSLIESVTEDRSMQFKRPLEIISDPAFTATSV